MDAYPTEEELLRIEKWPYDDCRGLFDFIEPLWINYGRILRPNPDTFDLATGGWSGNEDIIQAMRKNVMFWSICWQLSERGGRYVFEVKDLKR